jgi:hypothetical protein
VACGILEQRLWRSEIVSFFSSLSPCLVGTEAIERFVFVARLSGPITAWLAAKLGRKVRIKFGDVEVEARNVDELRKLLDLVDEHRKKKDDADAARSDDT